MNESEELQNHQLVLRVGLNYTHFWKIMIGNVPIFCHIKLLKKLPSKFSV